VKHTFLEFDEDSSNGFDDDAMVAGMCSSRRGRSLSDSDIRYGGSDGDSDSASRKVSDGEIQTTEYDSCSVSDGDSDSSWASLDVTSKTATQAYPTAWVHLDNATSSCVAQEAASADSGSCSWALYCSVPATPTHSPGLQSWTPNTVAPSAREWDSQAAQLRAQAREAEEAAAQVKACLAATLKAQAQEAEAQAQEAETQAREAQRCRRNGIPRGLPMQNAVSATPESRAMATAGNLQSVSAQNLPPSAAEFHTQAANLTSQAQEAEEAACLMWAKVRELRRVSGQNLCNVRVARDVEEATHLAQTKAGAPWLYNNRAHPNGLTFALVDPRAAVPTPQVTASMQAPTPQPPSSMVPSMPVPAFSICLSKEIPECAEVSTAHEHPMLIKQEQGDSQLQCTVSAEPTTLMLRNIPNSYTRDMLIELLDQEELQGSYDLVFVPLDFRSLASLGYAFVNFTSNANAERAKGKLQGFNSWGVTSYKVCQVAWGSTHQGLSAHIKHYRNSPVMHKTVPESYKPALFKDGIRVAFPGPTKKIQAPRIK